MDNDILKKLAKHFDNKIFYNSYILIAGKNQKLTKFKINFNSDEFTHFTGLEHLPTISNKITPTNKKDKPRKLRQKVYNLIRNGHWGYLQFTENDKIAFKNTKLMPNTYNPNTKTGCTIEERIQALIKLNLKKDIKEKTELYQWSKAIGKKGIRLSDNKVRVCDISADFVLKIPTKTESYFMYIFMYAENKPFSLGTKETINLNVISAFCDGVDLTKGQERPLSVLNYEIINNDGKVEHIFGDIENNAVNGNTNFTITVQTPISYNISNSIGLGSIPLNPPKQVTVTLPIPPKPPFKEWFAKALNIIKGTFVSTKEDLKSKKEAAAAKEPSVKDEKQTNTPMMSDMQQSNEHKTQDDINIRPQSQQRRSYNSFKGITPKAQSTKQNSEQQKHKTKTSPNKKNPSL